MGKRPPDRERRSRVAIPRCAEILPHAFKGLAQRRYGVYFTGQTFIGNGSLGSEALVQRPVGSAI